MKLPKLYARSTSGKISEWEIEFNKTSFRTVSGFQGMKQITSEWTECFAKSYNTQAEQTEKQARALWKKKVESGMFEDINKIDDDTFFEPMLCKEYKDEKDKIKFPIGSSKKLDGVRCIIRKNGMWTRTGKKIISAPHIFESLKKQFEKDPSLILDGELYCDKLSNDFNKIISCVRKTKPTQEDLEESAKYIEYWVYDKPSNLPYKERMEILKQFIKDSKNPLLILVDYDLVNSHEEINIKFTEYISQGYEGQILRVLNGTYENKRSKLLLKNKSFITEEFIILAVNEGVGKLKNKAGTVTIKTTDGVVVEPTINGSHKFLDDLWKRKKEVIGKEGTVRYFGKTEDGSLRFPKLIDIDRWEWE